MPDTSAPATTKAQRDLMAHAVDLEDRLKHKLKRPVRRLTEPAFRNYYCAAVGGEDDATITTLCEMGLMRKGPLINDGRDYYACVTEAGLRELMP